MLGSAKRWERCSDGGEDQGTEEALWGRRRRRIITSVLERAVSRERLFLSARWNSRQFASVIVGACDGRHNTHTHIPACRRT